MNWKAPTNHRGPTRFAGDHHGVDEVTDYFTPKTKSGRGDPACG